MATYYWVNGNGTWNNSSKTNWSNSSGGSGGFGPPLSTDTVNFDSLSGTGTCTTDSTAVASAINLNSSTLGLTLGANLTINNVFTLTLGTLSLGSYTLTALQLSSTNSNVRSINFGTGNITLTGNASTLVFMQTATNFTYTGTPTLNLSYSGATGTRTIAFGSSTGGSETNCFNINVTAGTDIVTIYNHVKNLNFTGFNGTFANVAKSIYGNLITSSGMTFSAGSGTISLASTLVQQNIKTNNVTLDFPITISGTQNVQLQDNLTLGATRTFTLTTGSLDLNNFTLNTGLFSSSNSNNRSIIFGTGNITLTGNNGVIFNQSTITNFLYTGTPTINATYSGSVGTRQLTVSVAALEVQTLNFNISNGSDAITLTSAVKDINFTGFSGTLNNGSHYIYGNATFSSGMTITSDTNVTYFKATSSDKTITTNGKTLNFPITFDGVNGVWTCQDALNISSSYSLTLTNGTLNLKAGTTSNISSFITTGTNNKYLGSSLAGTQAIISSSSGINSVSYLTISDINAIGGATWSAFITNQNIDNGNNSGWDFFIEIGPYIYNVRKNKRLLLPR